MVDARQHSRFTGMVTLLLFASGMVVAQESAAPRPAPSPPPAEVEGDPPTLAELKALGALRSIYRNSERPSGDVATPEPQLEAFRRDIQPILFETCVGCHGPDEESGNLRIDTLDANLFHGDDVDWWLEVLAVLTNGEMPPGGDSELADQDRAKIIDWLSSELQVASAVRRSEGGHSSFRRLTRYEYNYALQDLLGLPYDFAKDLPPDPVSEDGFHNSSEVLHMSAMQFETYRELGRKALLRATVQGSPPDPLFWGVSMKDASAVEWPKLDHQLEQLRQKHAEKLAKLEKEQANEEKATQEQATQEQATQERTTKEQVKQELEKELAKKEAAFRARPNHAYYEDRSTGRIARATWGYNGAKYARLPQGERSDVPSEPSEVVAVIPTGRALIVELGDQVPDEGILRVRVRASRRLAEESRVPSLQLEFGWQASNDSRASVRVSDRDLAMTATPDDPQFYEWEVPLGDVYPRNSVRKLSKMGDTPSPSEFIKLFNSSASSVDVQLDFIEVSVHTHDRWPPLSHTSIFPEQILDCDESPYARGVIEKFATRAWRRPLRSAELERKVELFRRVRPECDTLEEATIEVLATVLSSPNFLYLAPPNSSTERLPDEASAEFELATRLAIVLWCSTPDEELHRLAATGRLSESEVLTAQIQRMLRDPRSRRFSTHFVRQWLGMDLLDYLSVDRKAYPHFNRLLREAMLEEPIAFFHEVLGEDHSVLEFIHSDFTMVNERLANHYGVQDVHGNDFRRVSLEPQHRRGGVLTQAGLLAMNSDGKDSHPLKRGIWLLESLLNDPPPPPPPAVPEIDLADPEIAKMTLKERIENHRNDPACLSCHVKIDPWGIAFEGFDAVGSWRTHIDGKPVDASSLLFNQQKLDGMDGLKRFLLQNRQDQFVHAMVHKLTTYALGRPLRFGDRAALDRITAEVRMQGDGLATMLTAVLTSDLLRSK